tara:strand:+ start:513 stop:737 length:225 start_codon:yes stop_codon:yes gene_type:complete
VSLLPPLNASSEVIGRFEEAACMERNYFTPNVWKYTSEKLIKEWVTLCLSFFLIFQDSERTSTKSIYPREGDHS